MTKNILLKIITVTIAISLLGFCSGLAYDDAASKGKEQKVVDHGHWYTGEVIEKLNYDSLWDEATNLKDSPEGNQVFDNCINKYGGLEHLNKLKNMDIEFISASLLNDNTGIVNLLYDSDLKYKKIRTINDTLTVSYTLNSEKAFKTVNNNSAQLETGGYKAELYSYLVLSMPAGANYKTFPEIKFGTRLDDSLNYIYLKKEDSLIMVLGIDPEDNYIKKIEGMIIQDEYRTVFINYFSAFQEYDGYILPSSKMNVSMGLKMSEYTIKSVKINQEIDENIYKID